MAKYISLRIEALRGQAILAIQEEYRDFSERLELVAGDEVAIIPPISGG
jgi:molybdopterin converting factor small subunit